MTQSIFYYIVKEYIKKYIKNTIFSHKYIFHLHIVREHIYS